MDFEKFPDLLVLNDQELKQALDAWDVFARALALGIIAGKRTEALGFADPLVVLFGRGVPQAGVGISDRSRPRCAISQRPAASICRAFRHASTSVSAARRSTIAAKLLLIALKHSQNPPIGALGWVRANQRIVEKEGVDPAIKSRADALFGNDLSWAAEGPPGFFRIPELH